MTTTEEKKVLPCNTAIAQSSECKVIASKGESYTIPKSLELRRAASALKKPTYKR